MTFVQQLLYKRQLHICNLHCIYNGLALRSHKSNQDRRYRLRIHMLDLLRKLEKNTINEHISVATQTIGIERTTPTLLERMLKSTIGFSDMVEKNNRSQIIQQKHEFFVKNSMLSDCYFYLGYINKDNFVKIKDNLNRDYFFPPFQKSQLLTLAYAQVKLELFFQFQLFE